MKRLPLLSLLLLLAIPAGAADAALTLNSMYSAVRTDPATDLVDYWQVRSGPGVMISLFGYNNGSQQYIQLFDATNAAPTIAVTAWSATVDNFTNAFHGLSIGQPVQLTGTVATIAAGIYYVGMATNGAGVVISDPNSFYLYDTKANAMAGTTTGRQNISGSSSTATLNLVPFHTFVIGAANNYSCIVPNTGMSFGKSLLIAVSTSAGTYTAGAKDVTMTATLKSQ